MAPPGAPEVQVVGASWLALSAATSIESKVVVSNGDECLEFGEKIPMFNRRP